MVPRGWSLLAGQDFLIIQSNISTIMWREDTTCYEDARRSQRMLIIISRSQTNLSLSSLFDFLFSEHGSVDRSLSLSLSWPRSVICGKKLHLPALQSAPGPCEARAEPRRRSQPQITHNTCIYCLCLQRGQKHAPSLSPSLNCIRNLTCWPPVSCQSDYSFCFLSSAAPERSARSNLRRDKEERQ